MKFYFRKLINIMIALGLFVLNGQAQQLPRVRLDSFFKAQPSGIAFCIREKGRVVYSNTTSDTLSAVTNFRMASVTKQFTGMAILLLAKEGKLSLDDSLRHWLPEIPLALGKNIRIRHLLNHCSGLPDYESLVPVSQTTQVFDEDIPGLLQRADTSYFPSGTKFRYSNTGFCLLSLIIEKASGDSYPDFLRKRLFLPRHMKNSRVYISGGGIPHRAMGQPVDQSVTSATRGDGGVYTSLDDYGKWIESLHESPPAGFRINEDDYYSAGWFLHGNDLWFHTGGTCGFTNLVIHQPRESWTLIYFSNLADNHAPVRAILDILREAQIKDFSNITLLQELIR